MKKGLRGKLVLCGGTIEAREPELVTKPGDYRRVRLLLSDKPCDYIEVRVSDYSPNELEIRCGNGRLYIHPEVANVVRIGAEKL